MWPSRSTSKVAAMVMKIEVKKPISPGMALAMTVLVMALWTIPAGPSFVVAARLLKPNTKSLKVLKPLDICDFYFDGYEFTVPTFAIQQAGDITYGPIFKTRSMIPPPMVGETYDAQEILTHRFYREPGQRGRPKKEYLVRFMYQLDCGVDQWPTKVELEASAPRVVATYERMLKERAQVR